MMYKLLVVDDEYHIRDGLMNDVPWSNIGIQVVGEAIDGIDAMEKCRDLVPDIVITDINMDNMNGLEFAEKLKDTYPEIRVIIVTGYNMFNYAKKALDLGIYSYILKPIEEDELINTVKKLIEEIDEEKKLKQTMEVLQSELKANMLLIKDKFLNDLIEGRFDSEEEILAKMSFLGIEFSGSFHTCCVFNIDGYFSQYKAIGEKGMQLLVLGVSKVINEIFRKTYPTLSTLMSAGKIVCVISGFLTGGKKDLNNLFQIITKVKDSIKTVSKVSVSVGIGNLYKHLILIKDAYSEASKALEYNALRGSDLIIHIADVLPASPYRSIYPIKHEHRIINGINADSEYEVGLAIDGFMKEIESQNCTKNELRIIVIHMYSILSSKFMEMNVDNQIFEKELSGLYKEIELFESFSEIKDSIKRMVSYAMKALSNQRISEVNNIIKRAREYIRQNFSNPDITLTEISDNIYISPDYLSKLLKKETGDTYIDILTKCRIDEAKRLLKETNMKTANIGSAVGYPNSQYFCTIFKKNTGVTPVDYRLSKA